LLASRVYKRANDWRLHLQPKVLPPSQEVRDAVDLIVMAAVREREHFAQEVGMLCEVDLSRLELGGMSRHPIHLVADRPDADGMDQAYGHGVSKILQQARARSSILDQDRGRFVLLGEVLTFRRRWIYLDLLQMRSA
jgi:hypothetical protein